MFSTSRSSTAVNNHAKAKDAPTRRMDRNDKMLLRTSDWVDNSEKSLRLEDKVSLADAKAAFLQGLVVYVGKVHFARGTYVGIQLTGPSIGRGTCNGVYQGKKYFADVGKNNGIMAPINKVHRRLAMKTGDPLVDRAQQRRASEEARMADLQFVDALTESRSLAMLREAEERHNKKTLAGLMGMVKEETHITRLKQLRLAELMRSRGQDPDYVITAVEGDINAPDLKYASRDSPLQQCDLDLAEGLEYTQQNFCLSDPTLPDNPITFASQSFLNMTGYDLNEILGKNCRFLQGDETDQYAVYRIRLSIEEGSDCHVCLTNYRKDGSKFYNRLFMTALRDTKGRIKNYLGVQCEVSKEVALRINSEEKEKLENRLYAARMKATEEMSEHSTSQHGSNPRRSTTSGGGLRGSANSTTSRGGDLRGSANSTTSNGMPRVSSRGSLTSVQSSGSSGVRRSSSKGSLSGQPQQQQSTSGSSNIRRSTSRNSLAGYQRTTSRGHLAGMGGESDSARRSTTRRRSVGEFDVGVDIDEQHYYKELDHAHKPPRRLSADYSTASPTSESVGSMSYADTLDPEADVTAEDVAALYGS
ncbi:Blue-light-activated histidine kinase [Seminavis robusta]|uniref:Blue-light-activated histidine kinase n=1 Tax=Seminavis robusta TaxID=568900 RepID=A0A9N8F115_9STRA|nr:Blue-light-activated histidine kinase [Seminavis robusta]|eukprot:Sro2504_g329630.1 Blue-light-activated histidine kinase (587) ;mRNA; f:7350-9110